MQRFIEIEKVVFAVDGSLNKDANDCFKNVNYKSIMKRVLLELLNPYQYNLEKNIKINYKTFIMQK